MTAQLAVTFGQAGCLGREFRVRVDVVEHVPGGGEKVVLARRHEGAERQGVSPDEIDDLAIKFWRVVEGGVDAIEIPQTLLVASARRPHIPRQRGDKMGARFLIQPPAFRS